MDRLKQPWHALCHVLLHRPYVIVVVLAVTGIYDVERRQADQYDGSVPAGPNEVIVPIVEEQLVVEKRSVVKEYLRVRKNIVTEQQEVRDTVRHEFVEVAERPRNGAGASNTSLMRELP